MKTTPLQPQTPTDPIRIYVNNKLHLVPVGATLAHAIELSEVTPPFAAAVNMQFVPKASYEARVLLDSDRVELISPITGG